MQRILFLALALFVAVASVSGESRAQSAGVANIAVLDLNGIRRSAASIRGIRDQIGKFRDNFQQEIQKEQEALRNANQELARKRTLLSPEAFADERRKFEQQVVNVQRLVQERRKVLDDASNGAMLKVEEVLNQVVAEVASAKGYSLVIRRDQIVVMDNTLDITKEVLTQLDQRLPSVEVVLPQQQQ